MKKILHPTDFSRNASGALKIAYTLAQKQEAELVLVHIGELPTIMNSADLSSFRDMEEEKRASLSARLEAYCQEYIPGAGPAVDIRCETLLHGSIVKGLLALLRHEDPDLVVMGDHGQSRFKELVLGSTTRHLIAQAPCPVLAVPEGVAASGSFRHIVYASDYDAGDRQVVTRLAGFAALFDATITILHIFSQPAGNEAPKTTFQDKLSRQVSYPFLQFATRVSTHPVQTIRDYMQESGADLLVMYEREHSFPGRLFHRDKVQRLALHTTVPLLSYSHKALASYNLKAITSL